MITKIKQETFCLMAVLFIFSFTYNFLNMDMGNEKITPTNTPAYIKKGKTQKLHLESYRLLTFLFCLFKKWRDLKTWRISKRIYSERWDHFRKTGCAKNLCSPFLTTKPGTGLPRYRKAWRRRWQDWATSLVLRAGRHPGPAQIWWKWSATFL